MYATLNAPASAVAASRALAGGAADAGSAAALDRLVDQVCAEAAVWAPDAAIVAIAQARGDVAVAVGLVRVWAAALPELDAATVEPSAIRIVRRISAAYRNIPGGQWLGASIDFDGRLIRWPDEAPDTGPASMPTPEAPGAAAARVDDSPPRRDASPRVADLVAHLPILETPSTGHGADPAQRPIVLPACRADWLAFLARGETGALTALAARAMAARREAIVTELGSQVIELRIPHPRTGRSCGVVDVPACDAELVLDTEAGDGPGLALGYGASLGRIERRALSIAVLDALLQEEILGAAPGTIVLDQESIVAAVDGSATAGFVDHLRLPHYASFAAYVARLQSGAAALPASGWAANDYASGATGLPEETPDGH